MSDNTRTDQNLVAELEDLRSRLHEAEDTLEAIRSGAADALIVSGTDGPKVFTLSGADEVYRTFFQEMADGGLTVNSRGTILSSNQSLSEILGLTTEKLLGDRFQSFILPEDVEIFETALEKVFRDQTKAHIVLRTQSDRIVRTGVVAIEPQHPTNSELACIVVTDITESTRVEMERQLLLAQKFESLSTMAGGIAHDFNNQLMAVIGNLELALEEIPRDSEAEANVKKAIRASRLSAGLSRQMLTYAGSSLSCHVVLNLNELLSDDRIKFQTGASHSLIFNLADGQALPSIKGDPDQIQRLVRNILINASESIAEDDGHITIRTGVVHCDSKYLALSPLDKKPEPGLFVFLEISDTGCGMHPETLQRIFDPFFTTKFTGRGLGMAEVMGIVKGHGGAIILDSEVGKGSTIRVLFPVFEKVHSPVVKAGRILETEPLAMVSPPRRKTILVVEDEEMVRELVHRRLIALGYDTIEASDGEEGVAIYQDRHHEIDLVLLDFVMPRMNGVEAFRELTKIKPDVKVILSSGYTEDVVLEEFSGVRPAGILHKPYVIEELHSQLKRVLGTDGAN